MTPQPLCLAIDDTNGYQQFPARCWKLLDHADDHESGRSSSVMIEHADGTRDYQTITWPR